MALGGVTTTTVVVCNDCGAVLGVEHWWKSSHHRDECPRTFGHTSGVKFVPVVVPIP